MRLLLISIALLFYARDSSAVKVSITVNNSSGQYVTVKWAVFQQGQVPSEQECLNSENYGAFTDLINQLRSDSIDQKIDLEIPESQGTLIIIGKYRLGGRTSTSIRRRIETINRKNRDIRFNILKPLGYTSPSLDLEKFKNQIPELLHGEYSDLVKQNILGSFLLVNEDAEGNFKNVVPLIPSNDVVEVRYGGNGYSANDVFNSQVLGNLNLKLPGLPVAFKAALSTKNYAQISCSITNSGKVDIVPKDGKSYYELFLSISKDDMEVAKKLYKANNNIKLLLIVSANIIDSISYSTNELRQLEITGEINSSTVITAEANYSVIETSNQLTWETKKIGNVNLRDFAIYIENEIEKDLIKEAIERDTEELLAFYADLLEKYPNEVKTGLTEPNKIKDELKRVSDIIESTSNGEEVTLTDDQFVSIQKF